MRSDCPPQRLLEFLAGEAGVAASEAAEVVASSRAQEDALLDQACTSLLYPAHSQHIIVSVSIDSCKRSCHP